MYQEKFVVAVKHNGRVLREHGDTVLIPFGSEYTLTFKNLNSLRALVRVSVDGQDATVGTSIIVPANGSVDLERFLREGDGGRGNRFKFIERTSKIEDGPRGIKVEDGLIRVEFEFERQSAKIEDVTIKRTFVDEYWRTRPYWNGPYYTNAIAPLDGEPLRGVFGSATSATFNAADMLNSTTATSFSVSPTAQAQAEVAAAVGITVPGSISDQKFETGQWFPTDGQKHVMVLKLMGMVGEKVVKTPVTVKTKQKCTTCGHLNKSGAKFCSECGTGLELA